MENDRLDRALHLVALVTVGSDDVHYFARDAVLEGKRDAAERMPHLLPKFPLNHLAGRVLIVFERLADIGEQRAGDEMIALNGNATRFLVDTGSATTLIDTQVAVKSGTGVTALAGYGAGGAGGLVEGVNRTSVKELTIGKFKLANAEVVVAHVSRDILLSNSAAESNAGVVGQDYLASNFAVIDMGGMALYLRHPDSR